MNLEKYKEKILYIVTFLVVIVGYIYYDYIFLQLNSIYDIIYIYKETILFSIYIFYAIAMSLDISLYYDYEKNILVNEFSFGIGYLCTILLVYFLNPTLHFIFDVGFSILVGTFLWVISIYFISSFINKVFIIKGFGKNITNTVDDPYGDKHAQKILNENNEN